METVSICGIKVHPFSSRNELIDFAFSRKGILVAVNAEKSINATDRLRCIINDNIGYCDGAGAVKGAQRKGAHNAIRIPGCELWLDIIDRFSPQGKSFYLIGSRQEVVEGVVGHLRQIHPEINIAGFRNGFICHDKEKEALLDDITLKRPTLFSWPWVPPNRNISCMKCSADTKPYTKGWEDHSTCLWATSNVPHGWCNGWEENGCGGSWPSRHA